MIINEETRKDPIWVKGMEENNPQKQVGGVNS